MDISQIVKGAFRALDRNSPVILTAIGVAGVVSTTVLAVRVTPEALERISEFENKENGLWVKSTPVEKIQLTWPLYLPAALSGVSSIAAIIGAQSINSRRQAILLSGVTLAEKALTEYQDKVVELEGPETDRKVRDAIAKDHVMANPPGEKELIFTGQDVLCKDDYTGRYFHSTMEKIRQAQNDVNAQIIQGDMYASLNEFYMALGLSPTKGGEEVGWSAENLIDLNFTSVLTPEIDGNGGIPVLVMGFRARPLQDYYRFR